MDTPPVEALSQLMTFRGVQFRPHRLRSKLIERHQQQQRQQQHWKSKNIKTNRVKKGEIGEGLSMQSIQIEHSFDRLYSIYEDGEQLRYKKYLNL